MASFGFRPQAPESQFGLRRKIALASSDYGINLAYHSLELFLLFFYTDIAGLSPLFAGAVLTLGSVWDGIFDPIIGSLADRTRTRWGRFRPWVIGSGPALGVMLALIFHKPDLQGAALATYALVTHLLFRTAYAAATIPFVGLTARLTHDAGDRATISALRMQFAGLASLTVAFGFPFVRDLFPPDRAATGIGVAAALFGAAITPVFFFSMRSVKEPVEPDRPMPPRRGVGAAVSEDLRAYRLLLSTNRPLIRVLLGTMLVSTAGTLVYKTALYYYKYFAMQPDLGKYALGMAAVAQLALAPVWAFVANRTSKRTGWFIAAGTGIVALSGLGLIPRGWPNATLGLFFLFGASNCGLSVMFWSMIPDTVEMNDLQLGARFEAKTVGLALFARKMTLALDALLVGAVLQFAGFRPNMDQSAGALGAIRALVGFAPAACLILTILVMLGYRLGHSEHARIRMAIAKRDAASGTA